MAKEFVEGNAEQRYIEDATLLIKKLYENKIELKHGELNAMGVHILIKTMNRLTNEKSISEIADSI